MKKLIFVFLLTIFLVGCQYFQDQLEAPQNLRYENGYILFDEVEGATEYIIYTDYDDHNVSTTSFYFDYPGEHHITIVAFGENYSPSDPSEPLLITIPYSLAGPKNLMYVEGILSFDEVQNAVQYRIDLGVHGAFTTVDNIIDISDRIPYYGAYAQIRVRAIFEYGQSNFSETLYITDGKPFIKKLTFNYSKVSSSNLILFNESEIYTIKSVILTAHDSEVDENNYTLSPSFAFTAEYLDTLSLGKQYFTLETHRGFISVEINITDETDPYIINSTDIYVDFTTDINLLFELFGGEIISLTAKNLTSSDYILNGSTATIKLDYLNEIFDIGREELIIRYELKVGNNYTIGYITLTDNT